MAQTWKDKLLLDLFEMTKTGKFCDTEILTGDGERIKAHASILVSRSNLIKRTFESSISPSYKLKTESISAQLWDLILRYIYLGNVQADDSNLTDLYRAAQLLEVTSLIRVCKHYLDQKGVKESSGKASLKFSIETQVSADIIDIATGDSLQLNVSGAGDMDTCQLSQPDEDQDQEYEFDEIESDQQHRSTFVVTTTVMNKDEPVTQSPFVKKAEVKSEENRSLLPFKTAKDGRFECQVCARVVKTKQILVRHLATHQNEFPFSCDECGKGFKHERYLQVHKQRHSEDAQFQCGTCGKRFKTSRDALWHSKTVHTDEKKFRCTHCDFATKTRNLLQQHVQQHTGHKNYRCNTCGKNFLRKQHLEQHAARHDGKREFICSVCGAEFYTVYACRDHHLRIHQGLKRFECSVCGQQYSEKKSFMRHLQKHSVDLVLDGSEVVEAAEAHEFVIETEDDSQDLMVKAENHVTNDSYDVTNVVSMETAVVMEQGMITSGQHTGSLIDSVASRLVPGEGTLVVEEGGGEGGGEEGVVYLTMGDTEGGVEYQFVTGDDVVIDTQFMSEAAVS